MEIHTIVSSVVQGIADICRSPVDYRPEKNEWVTSVPVAALRSSVLAFFQVKDEYIDHGYADVTLRLFVGEATNEFNPFGALAENFRYDDTSWSSENFGDAVVLVFADRLRVLVDWGADEIRGALEMRWHTTFMVTPVLPGLIALREEVVARVLASRGF